jgi:hypothetical protein
MISWFGDWLRAAPIPVIGASVLILMAIASVTGGRLRRWHDRTAAPPPPGRAQPAEGPTVTAVLTLLALLLGFSFNLAMERFEQRRQLVVEEADAIDTAYLRAQLLPEPHRKRIGDILIAYTDNRIALATIGAKREPALLVRNDALITDLWAATSAALGGIDRPDFSNAFLRSMNQVTELDATRKNARLIRVPEEIFAVLFVYMVVTSGLLGYLLTGLQGKLSAALVLVLMALFLLLIIDVDRPMQGTIRESQAPMEQLRARFAAQPPSVFDRYKPAARAGALTPPPAPTGAAAR